MKYLNFVSFFIDIKMCVKSFLQHTSFIQGISMALSLKQNYAKKSGFTQWVTISKQTIYL